MGVPMLERWDFYIETPPGIFQSPQVIGGLIVFRPFLPPSPLPPSAGWETSARLLTNASENLAGRVENRHGWVEFCIGYMRLPSSSEYQNISVSQPASHSIVTNISRSIPLIMHSTWLNFWEILPNFSYFSDFCVKFSIRFPQSHILFAIS